MTREQMIEIATKVISEMAYPEGFDPASIADNVVHAIEVGRANEAPIEPAPTTIKRMRLAYIHANPMAAVSAMGAYLACTASGHDPYTADDDRSYLIDRGMLAAVRELKSLLWPLQEIHDQFQPIKFADGYSATVGDVIEKFLEAVIDEHQHSHKSGPETHHGPQEHLPNARQGRR